MKPTRLALATLALSAMLLSSCNSGPNRLSRNWDTWVNGKYATSSWVHGALLQDVIPVYPVVGFVMKIGDILFVNTWYFWSKDAWDGKGTAYTYKQPEGAEKTVTGWRNASSTAAE